jgi:alpha-1,3-rhamnosyl/mannosyltransferase
MGKKAITVLFDAQPLLGQKTGVGYYTAQLITALTAEYPCELRLIGYYYNFLGRKPLPPMPSAPNLSYRRISLMPGQIVNQLRRWHIALPIELLARAKPDFVFYPNFWGPPSLFNIPQSPVIHDLSFKDYPQYASAKNVADLNRFVPPALRRASFVTTVSQFSKQRLAQDFGIPAAKIAVTPIPPPALQGETLQRRKEDGGILKKLRLTKPYLLFVGTIEPRKSLVTLLDAYAKLPKTLRDRYSLVIAGKTDWKYGKTLAKIRELQQAGHDISYLGYVDDATRGALYAGARLFVTPAIYEGFGMPVLEAFACGLPCVVSDISAFREVAGNVADYFPPRDARALAAALQAALSKSPQKSELQAYVASHFSWQSVARTLYARIEAATSKQQR